MSYPILLAIETSQRAGGIALRDAVGEVHVELLREDKRHDDDLMPAIERIVNKAGLSPRDLDAVGVSVGPGGFTGLRIAVTTAKMLAETLGVKVVAVPSALVVARSAESDDGPILVALASKADNAWVTRLENRSGIWTIIGEPGVTDAAAPLLEGVTCLIGDEFLPESFRTRAAEAGVPVIEPSFDPAACLAATDHMLGENRTTDPLVLSPMYPRPPEAVSLWEKRQRSG